MCVVIIIVVGCVGTTTMTFFFGTWYSLYGCNSTYAADATQFATAQDASFPTDHHGVVDRGSSRRPMVVLASGVFSTIAWCT